MDKAKLADVNRYAKCYWYAHEAKPGLERHFWNAQGAYWIACALADNSKGEYRAAAVAAFYDKQLTGRYA
jgi:hypothetical protein